MAQRIASYERFWPYYLREHTDPRSRALHFVGTTGWFASVAGSAIANPIGFPLAMAGFGALLLHALRTGESKRPSYGHIAGMLALPTLAAPILFPGGVAFAYACAWIGHFGFEKNRPATFKYPLWSLVSDWKMWGHMVRGRLWKGDPVQELGLRAPQDDLDDADDTDMAAA